VVFVSQHADCLRNDGENEEKIKGEEEKMKS
jgi:hypothetical protein